MQIYSGFLPIPAPRGTALAMGFFDGLHIGHCQVVAAAVRWAAEQGCEAAVFTFTMQGMGKKGGRLETLEQKHAQLQKMGVDYIAEPPFSSFKDLTPEQFVRGIQADFKAKAVFCGPNFTFGKGAVGNVELLRTLCAPLGIQVFVIPFATDGGQPVSSTRIRQALAEGDVAAAARLLGHPYAVTLPVCHGRGLGRTLGVPTLNQIFPAEFQLPKSGIYITRVLLADGWHAGATGLGSRPTVNEDAADVTCETFLPDYHGDLYGAVVTTEFCKYLCPTRKFDTLDELRHCILSAASQAVAYFGGRADRLPEDFK